MATLTLEKLIARTPEKLEQATANLLAAESAFGSRLQQGVKAYQAVVLVRFVRNESELNRDAMSAIPATYAVDPGQQQGRAEQDQRAEWESLLRWAIEQVDQSWLGSCVQLAQHEAKLSFPNGKLAEDFAAMLHMQSEELHNRQAKQDEDALLVCAIGIGQGLTHRMGDQLSGPAVKFTEQLSLLARSGQTLVDQGTWTKLPADVQAAYRPVGDAEREHHLAGRAAYVRQVEVGAPWDHESTAYAERATRRVRRKRKPPGAAAFLAALAETERESAAPAPSDLNLALGEGMKAVAGLLERVEAKLKATSERPGASDSDLFDGSSEFRADAESKPRVGLSLSQIQAVCTEAIKFGAGPYNHSDRGRLSCGELYHFAATGLLRLATEFPNQPTPGLPREGALAISWLAPILNASPFLSAENGVPVAWELRFCFDALSVVPSCDQLSRILPVMATNDRANLLPQLGMSLIRKRAEAPTHIRVYELRHLVRVAHYVERVTNERYQIRNNGYVPIFDDMLADSHRVTSDNLELVGVKLIDAFVDCFRQHQMERDN